MGNTELSLLRLKQNWNSSTKMEKLGKRFPSFLCLGITGCSMLEHHWQCSRPALCKCAKRQRGDLCCLILFFLPHFFTFPATTSPLPTITAQTVAPSSHHLLQLSLIASCWEELDFHDSPWVPSSSGCSTILWLWAITGEGTEWGDAAATTRKQEKCHTDTAALGGSLLSITEERLDNVPVQQGYFRHKGNFSIQAGASTVPSPAQTKRSFSITPTTLKRKYYSKGRRLRMKTLQKAGFGFISENQPSYLLS